MRLWATLASVLTALVLLAAPAIAAPIDRQQLDQAVNRFQTGRVEEAVALFKELLARPLPADPAERADLAGIFREARPSYAACLVGTERVAEADVVILDHLRDDPFFELTPGKFPAELADRFDIVRAQNAAELDRAKQKILKQRQRALRDRLERQRLALARLKRIEEMAAEVQVIRTRSRLVAALPFGAGQFQNDDVGLGVFFATTQVAAIAGTIITGAIGVDLLQLRCAVDGLSCPEVTSQFTVVQTLNWLSFGTTFSLIAAGIIEAQMSFEDTSVSYQKRPIPAPITFVPEVGTTATGGGYIGLRGTF